MLHEVAGRDDGDLPGPHVRLVDDAAHAAPVVGMRVGIDHGRDGKALADVLLEQLPRRANHFRGHQRVEDDPAGLAPDEGDVGEVEAADLVDARDHLVEPVVVVQYGLAEQRGMNAVEFVLRIQKLKPLHVPGDMAGVRHDLEILHRSNEALLLLLEISLVGERQRRLCLLEHVQREFRWCFALGMKMSLQGVDLLSARGALIQDQMTGQGEGGCRSRNGLMNCRLVVIAYSSCITYGLGLARPAAICVDVCQGPAPRLCEIGSCVQPRSASGTYRTFNGSRREVWFRAKSGHA